MTGIGKRRLARLRVQAEEGRVVVFGESLVALIDELVRARASLERARRWKKRWGAGPEWSRLRREDEPDARI
jgi:hypothetical protein